MTSNRQKVRNNKEKPAPRLSKLTAKQLDILARQQTLPIAIIQKMGLDSRTLTPSDMLHLQRTIGNQGVSRVLTKTEPHIGTQAATGLIQRVLGEGVAKGEEVFNLLNPKDKFKVRQVDTEKGKYQLEDLNHPDDEDYYRWTGYYNPQFSLLPSDNAPLQTELAINKQTISKYCSTLHSRVYRRRGKRLRHE
jgi:hypothetical protein